MSPFKTIAAGAILAMAAFSPSHAQNLYEEVISYTVADGKIVLPVTISGNDYGLILDLGGRSSTAVLSEYSDAAGVVPNGAQVTYPRKGIKAISGGSLEKVGIGENIFFQRTGVFILDDDYIRDTGADGIAGTELFRDRVLTIDSRDRTITVSAPYKPSYVHLRNRSDMPSANVTVISIDGNDRNAVIDLWQEELLRVSDDSPEGSCTGEHDITFAGVSLGKHTVGQGENTALGAGILEYGILTIDYIKGKVYFEPWSTLEKPVVSQQSDALHTDGNIVHLDLRLFREKVFDFRAGGLWAYLGEKPAVIDFWAEWCGPCKLLEPVIKSLSDELEGEVVFYKLNIDEQKEIASYFGITAIPLLMYIPMEGEPVKVLGVRDTDEVRQTIKEILTD